MGTELGVRARARLGPRAETVTPLVRELPSDLTPLRALAAVEREAGAILLETAGPVGVGEEWILLAFDPLWRLDLPDGSLPGAPLDALGRAWPERVVMEPDPRAPFAGGLAGYIAYDFKDALHPYPRRARRESALPDVSLGYYDVVWAWERRSGAGWVVSSGIPGADRAAREASARPRLVAQWERIASGPEPGPGRPAGRGGSRPVPSAGDRVRSRSAPGRCLEADFTRARYIDAVGRALDHIAAGDIYQVNLAQRFLVRGAPPPASLFHRLRDRAPAPFGAFLVLAGGAGIVSSSPERFFRIQDDRIETWPIKGTRPRGDAPDRDAALAVELRASAKDRAENLMIVDLERNDLGRVCAIGSVRVSSLWGVESYSNVHHLVSRVEGTLRRDATPVEILRAMFPGGSITGAPKIRSIQIIDELEPVRRGVYTGAIGYWDARGGCDWSIAIRTVVVERGVASFHVGGGIVADSDPAAEYEETLAKASGMMAALDVRWGG